MSLENFLQNSGFVHIKEQGVGLQVPMIYIFRYNTALQVQNILGLENPPDFTLVRNVKLISKGTCVKRIDPRIPIEYSMYNFDESSKKISTIGGFAEQTIKGKYKVIRLQSSQEVLQTLEGVWVYRKYLN